MRRHTRAGFAYFPRDANSAGRAAFPTGILGQTCARETHAECGAASIGARGCITRRTLPAGTALIRATFRARCAIRAADLSRLHCRSDTFPRSIATTAGAGCRRTGRIACANTGTTALVVLTRAALVAGAATLLIRLPAARNARTICTAPIGARRRVANALRLADAADAFLGTTTNATRSSRGAALTRRESGSGDAGASRTAPVGTRGRSA